jgi:Methyltransferase domain
MNVSLHIFLTRIIQIIDKQTFMHNYGKFYDRYLSAYRRVQNLNYLVLGTQTGRSLQSFREYFPLAKFIVGIDHHETARAGQRIEENILVEIGSQTDEVFLTSLVQKYGAFDVILDDCSHVADKTIRSFEILFPLLRDQGVYIVEDVASMVDVLPYFQNLTNYLNKCRGMYGGDHVADPFKINIKIKNVLEYSIGDIVFSNSCILIYKEVKNHWIAGPHEEERRVHKSSLTERSLSDKEGIFLSVISE